MPVLASGLSDKKWTSVQIKDVIYLHNIKDGFRKYNGSTVSSITPAAEKPSDPSYNSAITGSLVAAKTYRWKLTFINPSLGIESEGSNQLERVLGGAETGAKLNIPTATAPYTRVRVYRTVADGNSFFLEGDTNAATFSSTAADSTLGISLDTTIDVMASIPTGNFIMAYKGFLNVIQANTIRFCRVVAEDSDAYWLETDKFSISTKFGQTSGAGVVGDTAIVFTPTSIHGYSGSTATTFKFRELKKGIGCASHFTIDHTPNGDMILFSGTKGVILIKENDITKLTESGQTVDITNLSSPALDSVFQGKDPDIQLNPASYSEARGYMDVDENTYHLYVSGWHFYFNLDNGSIGYEQYVNAYQAIYVKTGTQSSGAYIADKQGFLIREDISYGKLAPSGTVTGKPTSADRTTITDTGASFETIGDGLKGVYITIDHDISVETRQIISNTATSITVDAPWDQIPAVIDSYYIGYIHCRLLTKEYKLTENINDIIRGTYFGIVHDRAPSVQNLIIKRISDKQLLTRGPEGSWVLDLSTNLWDKTPYLIRGRLIQTYMYTHYNKQKSRDKTPVNISSYIFFIEPRGKL